MSGVQSCPLLKSYNYIAIYREYSHIYFGIYIKQNVERHVKNEKEKCEDYMVYVPHKYFKRFFKRCFMCGKSQVIVRSCNNINMNE